jgi:thiol-disulfide isomerase/thioredoxin
VDEHYRRRQTAELVWTGPAPRGTTLRRTDQVLLDLIRIAERTLHLVTFAAYKVHVLREAMLAAARRGVSVTLVFESPDASDASDGKTAYSGLYGETLTLDALRAPGKPVMLLFTDPNCSPCNTLLPEIGRWQQEHADKLSIALLSRGTPEENKSKSQEHGLTQVLLQKEWEVSEAYEVRGTPSAVVVCPDGTIGSPVAGGAEAIRELVTQAVEAPNRVSLLAGAPGPTAAPNGNGGPCPKCGKHHPAEGAPAQPATKKVGEAAPEIQLKNFSGIQQCQTCSLCVLHCRSNRVAE